MMTEKQIIKYISDWIKNYAEQAHMKGLVVGISGGIDSAVTSTLCAETGLPTLCLDLPIHQAETHQKRGNDHIQWLKGKYPNVSSLTMDLTPTFDVFSSQALQIDNTLSALTLANTRSRLRMTALYYFAGLYGYLVVGTGNKIEDFGVGFYTKYGDGGVDISPIADLMKSEVYALANTMQIIPSVLNATPSDGLFQEDISDEQQLGASYDELEWAMKVVENKEDTSVFEGRDKEVLEIYKRLNALNQHKMNPIPICKIPRG